MWLEIKQKETRVRPHKTIIERKPIIKRLIRCFLTLPSLAKICHMFMPVNSFKLLRANVYLSRKICAHFGPLLILRGVLTRFGPELMVLSETTGPLLGRQKNCHSIFHIFNFLEWLIKTRASSKVKQKAWKSLRFKELHTVMLCGT